MSGNEGRRRQQTKRKKEPNQDGGETEILGKGKKQMEE